MHNPTLYKLSPKKCKLHYVIVTKIWRGSLPSIRNKSLKSVIHRSWFIIIMD